VPTLARRIVEIEKPTSLSVPATEVSICAALGQEVPWTQIPASTKRLPSGPECSCRISEYRNSTWEDIAEVIADAEKAVMAKGWKLRPYGIVRPMLRSSAHTPHPRWRLHVSLTAG
jgi:hypothetical protein